MHSCRVAGLPAQLHLFSVMKRKASSPRCSARHWSRLPVWALVCSTLGACTRAQSRLLGRPEDQARPRVVGGETVCHIFFKAVLFTEPMFCTGAPIRISFYGLYFYSEPTGRGVFLWCNFDYTECPAYCSSLHRRYAHQPCHYYPCETWRYECTDQCWGSMASDGLVRSSGLQ